MSLIMPDGSRTVSFGPPGSGFPQYEDFMGQAAASGNKAAQKLASLPSQQQQAKPQQQQAQPQQSQSKSLDMSAYKPGQAQPIQPPSQGTPYQPSQQSRGYTEPTAQNGWQGGQIIDDRGMFPPQPPSQMPTQYSPSFLDGYQPPASSRPIPGQNGIPSDAIFRQPTNTQTYTTPGFTYSPGGTPQYGNQGNVANDPYNKPPPFVSTMTDMYGNPTTPEQFYPQQDAFIAQLLERMGQIQGGTWLGQGPPPADFGRRPDMNFGEMWNQGGQMVQDGWRNPFAQPVQQTIEEPHSSAPRFDSILAADAPWWAGEFGNLPHNPADNRPAYGPAGHATGANAVNFQPGAPQRNGMRYVPAEYRDGKLWSDAHYVNEAPPIPEYAPSWMDPGTARPIDVPSYGTPYGQPYQGRLNSQYADMYAPPLGAGWYY